MDFAANLEQLGAIMSFISQEATKAGFDNKEIRFIELACEEAVVNVINHAFSEKVLNPITIDALVEQNSLQIQIIDRGVAFNPLEKKIDVNTQATADVREVGGLGIFLMRTVVDHFDYKRENEKNVLSLTFVKDSKKRESS